MTAWATLDARFRSKRAAWLLVLLALAMLPWSAAVAGCYTLEGAGTVTFAMPTTLTVPTTAQVGDVIYQSPGATPSPVYAMYCFGDTGYGVSNSVGTTPSVSTSIYPTGVAGIGYRLIRGSSGTDYLLPWGCCEIGAGNRLLNGVVTLQLVKTGAVANGAQLPAGTIARWLYEQVFGTASLQNFVLGGAVRFTTAACQVNTSAIAVTLPTISSASLPAVDSTAGNTSFRIGLNCGSGATLKVSFSTTAPVAGKTGVIASGGGATAAGVGVQIVDSASNPVVFGTAAPVGVTPNGTMNLEYRARYYRTGTVTTGTVNATASFTLSYD